MTTPYAAYTATGQTDFVVPFPYINRQHVQVYVNGVLRALAPWPQDGIVRLLGSTNSGDFVELIRETPLDGPLVEFQDGNILTSQDLNLAVQQLLYRQQEVAALYERTLGEAKVRLAEANGLAVDGDEVLDQLLADLLENQTLADLRARYSDIDANAQALLVEIQARKDELQASVAALTADIDQRIASVDDTIEALDTKVDTKVAEVEATIASEVETLDGLLEALGVVVTGNHAAVVSDIQTLQTETEAQASSITGLSASLELSTDIFAMNFAEGVFEAEGPTVNARALVINEQSARVTQEAITARDISVLQVSVGEVNAAVLSEQQARIDGDGALATSLNALTVRVSDTEADIISEQTARSDGDTALANSLSALTVRVGDTEADIISEQTARADADTALSNSVTALVARVDDNEADIVSEQTARADGDTAIANDLTALTTRVGDAEADIISEQTARADADTAIASDVNGLTTRVGDAEADIVSEANARSSADTAISNDLSALTTRVGDAEADIISEQNARSSADSAIASDVTALTTRVGGTEADVLSEQQARVSGDNALASDLSALTVRMGSAETDIVNEQSARASADSALATDITALYTRVDGADAAILSEQSARATADDAIASDFTGLVAERDITEDIFRMNFALGQYEAELPTVSTKAEALRERSVRATNERVVAEELSSISTRVGANEASVSSFATSINGLEAKYGVSLDVNGYVTGFAQHNNGTTGTFVVRADKFSVVSSDGSNLVSPFTVTASGVQINGNLVVSGSITANQMAANAVTDGNDAYTNAALSVGTNTWTSVQSASLTVTAGSRVRVDFCGAYDVFNQTSGGGSVAYRIKRGSTVVREGTFCVIFGQTTVTIQDSETYEQIGTVDIPVPVSGTYSVFAVDPSPPAGTHTYSIELNSTRGGLIRSRQLGLLEFKR